MKLYYAPGACSLAVHIALREIGANFDGVAVDLAKHTTADGADFHAISPRGYVPLLQLDDGSRHTEASSLLQCEYSVADAYAFTIVNWANFLAMPLTPYPHLKTYVDRVSHRPRVQDALRAEGLVQ